MLPWSTANLDEGSIDISDISSTLHTLTDSKRRSGSFHSREREMRDLRSFAPFFLPPSPTNSKAQSSSRGGASRHLRRQKAKCEMDAEGPIRARQAEWRVTQDYCVALLCDKRQVTNGKCESVMIRICISHRWHGCVCSRCRHGPAGFALDVKEPKAAGGRPSGCTCARS